jgi:hypothetical protein
LAGRAFVVEAGRLLQRDVTAELDTWA